MVDGWSLAVIDSKEKEWKAEGISYSLASCDGQASPQLWFPWDQRVEESMILIQKHWMGVSSQALVRTGRISGIS